jgi:predicted dehydrogenase/threonine dehydrogenase-like Zn-dependent dehydrogenase
MKQVLQDLKTGETLVAEVPCPHLPRGHVLVRSTRSLISTGTERMLVDFGKAGWIDKARQQPDKVRQVLDKIRTDGLLPTLEAVRNKLEQPMPMGYSNVGCVVAVGAGVENFAPGDRVVSNGRHAEMIAVPVNLCAKVPAGVSDEEAAFTVLGAIALQGIRLANPALGENVTVIGLGLIGLLAVQLLRAQGCRVLGTDFDPAKLALAARYGAEVVDLSTGADPVAVAQRFSRGRGMDAVLITAATDSNEPVRQAALMSRKRGRIVLVGVAGLELSRADFYEKELTFQVSCSYGPGRYDPNYEEKGNDYPVGFVRWTEQRNFEALLDMLADRRIDVSELVSHRFAIADAPRAYEVVTGEAPSLGILLEYPADGTPAVAAAARTVELTAKTTGDARGAVVGFIGAGNYASAKLIPAFARAGAKLHTIASGAGVSGWQAGRKYGFERVTTDMTEILRDPQISAAVIATRHDAHAAQVLAAREHGKHVFVEKPLCLTFDELARIEAAWAGEAPRLMVGFNRRFAPHVVRMAELLAGAPGPKSFVFTANAGAIPAGHWTQDPAVGGGRIVGEACHFIDLLRFLAGAPIVAHSSVALDDTTRDTVTITLRFADGSIGAIHYFANGNKGFPKERLDVFASGRSLHLDNFRRLAGHGFAGFRRMTLWSQDKGQDACARAFVDSIARGGAAPIPVAEIFEVSRVSIEIARDLG